MAIVWQGAPLRQERFPANTHTHSRTHTHNKKEVKRGRRLSNGEKRADMTVGWTGIGVARAASVTDGIKAGSLRRNKSKPERTQGPGSYLGWALCRGPDGVWTFFRREPHTTPWSHLVADAVFFSKLQRLLLEGGAMGAASLFFFLFSYPLSSNTQPHPFILLFFPFVHVSRLQPLFLLRSMEREQAC